MENHVVIIVDLGFGDAGKGLVTAAVVDHLKSSLVVRYNGGAQAAHTVVQQGVKHQFKMFGSGTLSGVPTLLLNTVSTDPIVLYKEQKALEQKIGCSVAENLYIDGECPITTHYHKLVNRALEESRGDNKHGSCGMGIAATRKCFNNSSTPLAVKSIYDLKTLTTALEYVREWALTQLERVGIPSYIDQCKDQELFDAAIEIYPKIYKLFNIVDQYDPLKKYRETGVVFEGAQGTLLDQDFGFYPYVTPSNTSIEHAMDILDKADMISYVNIRTIGVMRAYQCRHGMGPLPTETKDLGLEDHNNPTNQYQGDFRIGWLDLPLAKYAIDINLGCIDYLGVTCLDQVMGKNVKVAIDYGFDIAERLKSGTTMPELTAMVTQVKPTYVDKTVDDSFPEFISRFLKKPIALTSKGPSISDVQFM